MSSSLKKIVTILSIIGCFAFGYIVIVDGGDSTGVMDEATMQKQVEISNRANKILADIQKIDQYSLDDAIFSDVRFTSLKDNHFDVPEVATGRENPFMSLQ